MDGGVYRGCRIVTDIGRRFSHIPSQEQGTLLITYQQWLLGIR